MNEPNASVTEGRHLLIVGGGIAGMAAALRARALDPGCHITLVDAAARLGGKIDGEVVAGCVIDGGADVCIGTKLRETHLFNDLQLDKHAIRVNPNALASYEKRDGALQAATTTFTDELLTFPKGMRELVDLTCSALENVTTVINSPMESLRATDSQWTLTARNCDTLLADAVIVATPATAASALLCSVAAAPATALSTLEYPPTTTVTMAWRAADVEHPLHGTGYLSTEPDSPVSACTWTSSKNPSHAAPGLVLVRGYVRGPVGGGAALVLEEMANVLGITAPPVFSRSYEWPEGIPVYTPEHEANVRALQESLAAVPGVFVAGSAFHGVGIPDCISSGERAAAAAIAFLATGSCEGTT